MEYKTITYRRVKNLGSYENESFELTVEVTESDNVDQVMDELRQTAFDRLGVKEQVRDLDDRKEYLENQLMELQKQIDAARQKWNKITQFMSKLGMNPNADDIPF